MGHSREIRFGTEMAALHDGERAILQIGLFECGPEADEIIGRNSAEERRIAMNILL